LQLSYDAPHYHSDLGKKHYHALVLLAHLLGGNQTTEFYDYFINRKKLALFVSADYEGASIDPKDFSISAAMQPSDNIEILKDEIKKWLDRVQKNGVTADDLARAKTDMIGSLAYLKDGTDGLLTTIADYVAKGLSLDDLNTWQEKIEAVTIDDIKAAAKIIFENEPAVTIEIFPDSKNLESAATSEPVTT
jgi:zinc protease